MATVVIVIATVEIESTIHSTEIYLTSSICLDTDLIVNAKIDKSSPPKDHFLVG